MASSAVIWSEDFTMKFAEVFLKYNEIHDRQDQSKYSQGVRKRASKLMKAELNLLSGTNLYNLITNFHKVFLNKVKKYLTPGKKLSLDAPQWMHDVENRLQYIRKSMVTESKPKRRDVNISRQPKRQSLFVQDVMTLVREERCTNFNPNFKALAHKYDLHEHEVLTVYNDMMEVSVAKVRQIIRAGDMAMLVSSTTYPTRDNWLLHDLHVMHVGINVLNEESYTSVQQLRALVATLHLVQHVELEPLPTCAQEVQRRWRRATELYTERGGSVSCVLLQRRWYEMKLDARLSWQKWIRERKCSIVRPLPIHISIVRRYPHVASEPLPPWSDLVSSGKIVHIEIEERKSKAVILKPLPLESNLETNDSEDDLILIEKKIEYVDLLDDNIKNNEDDVPKLVIDELGNKIKPDFINTNSHDNNMKTGINVSYAELNLDTGQSANNNENSILNVLNQLDPNKIQATIIFDSDSDDQINNKPTENTTDIIAEIVPTATEISDKTGDNYTKKESSVLFKSKIINYNYSESTKVSANIAEMDKLEDCENIDVSRTKNKNLYERLDIEKTNQNISQIVENSQNNISDASLSEVNNIQKALPKELAQNVEVTSIITDSSIEVPPDHLMNKTKNDVTNKLESSIESYGLNQISKNIDNKATTSKQIHLSPYINRHDAQNGETTPKIDEKLVMLCQIRLLKLEASQTWRRHARNNTVDLSRMNLKQFQNELKSTRYTELNVKQTRLSKAFRMRNKDLLKLCVPVTVDVEWMNLKDLKAIRPGRSTKKVRLPDIDEIRRINKRILTAEVAPINVNNNSEEGRSNRSDTLILLNNCTDAQPSSLNTAEYLDNSLLVRRRIAVYREESEEDSTDTGDSNDLELMDMPLTHTEIAKALDLITREGNKRSSSSYCCLARRHRSINDARRRIAAHANRNAIEQAIHAHTSSECKCCCRHLLVTEAARSRLVQRRERLLQEHIAALFAPSPPCKRSVDTDTCARVSTDYPLPSNATKRNIDESSTSSEEYRLHIMDEKHKSKKRRSSKKKTSDEDAHYEAKTLESEYEKWVREKNLVAERYGIKPRSTKSLCDQNQKALEIAKVKNDSNIKTNNISKEKSEISTNNVVHSEATVQTNTENLSDCPMVINVDDGSKSDAEITATHKMNVKSIDDNIVPDTTNNKSKYDNNKNKIAVCDADVSKMNETSVISMEITRVFSKSIEKEQLIAINQNKKDNQTEFVKLKLNHPELIKALSIGQPSPTVTIGTNSLNSRYKLYTCPQLLSLNETISNLNTACKVPQNNTRKIEKVKVMSGSSSNQQPLFMPLIEHSQKEASNRTVIEVDNVTTNATVAKASESLNNQSTSMLKLDNVNANQSDIYTNKIDSIETALQINVILQNKPLNYFPVITQADVQNIILLNNSNLNIPTCNTYTYINNDSPLLNQTKILPKKTKRKKIMRLNSRAKSKSVNDHREGSVKLRKPVYEFKDGRLVLTGFEIAETREEVVIEQYEPVQATPRPIITAVRSLCKPNSKENDIESSKPMGSKHSVHRNEVLHKGPTEEIQCVMKEAGVVTAREYVSWNRKKGRDLTQLRLMCSDSTKSNNLMIAGVYKVVTDADIRVVNPIYWAFDDDQLCKYKPLRLDIDDEEEPPSASDMTPLSNSPKDSTLGIDDAPVSESPIDPNPTLDADQDDAPVSQSPIDPNPSLDAEQYFESPIASTPSLYADKDFESPIASSSSLDAAPISESPIDSCSPPVADPHPESPTDPSSDPISESLVNCALSLDAAPISELPTDSTSLAAAPISESTIDAINSMVAAPISESPTDSTSLAAAPITELTIDAVNSMDAATMSESPTDSAAPISESTIDAMNSMDAAPISESPTDSTSLAAAPISESTIDAKNSTDAAPISESLTDTTSLAAAPISESTMDAMNSMDAAPLSKSTEPITSSGSGSDSPVEPTSMDIPSISTFSSLPKIKVKSFAKLIDENTMSCDNNGTNFVNKSGTDDGSTSSAIIASDVDTNNLHTGDKTKNSNSKETNINTGAIGEKTASDNELANILASSPDRVCHRNKVYKRLQKKPLLYAQVYTQVYDLKMFHHLRAIGVPLYLWRLNSTSLLQLQNGNREYTCKKIAVGGGRISVKRAGSESLLKNNHPRKKNKQLTATPMIVRETINLLSSSDESDNNCDESRKFIRALSREKEPAVEQ